MRNEEDILDASVAIRSKMSFTNLESLFSNTNK